MQLVNERWYQWYSLLATVLAGLLAVGCILTWVIPGMKETGQSLGLNYITFAVSLVTILYRFTGYPVQAKRFGPSQAMIILSSIQSVNAMNLLHSTGQLESFYWLFWAIILFLAGMFGIYAIAGVYFILSMYYILFSRNREGELMFSLIGTIAIVLLLGIGIGSYFFWKRRYVNADSAAVRRLSGQLKSKQQQSEALLQVVSDGIMLIDAEGKIGLINRAAAAMVEWTVDEANSMDYKLVIKLAKEDGKEFEAGEDPIENAKQQLQAVTTTVQLIGRNGKTQIVSLALTPIIENEQVVGMVAVFRDVSDARAEEARRADFISTASHEMRTPVAAIEGYLALALNDKVSKIDSKARNFLEKAHSSTQHLGKLFQDLLTSAKAEDGRLVSHPVVIEMGTYLDQLVEGLRFAAEKKGLLMDFTVGASSADTGANKVVRPLYYVHADPDRLREVITNIFDNAVKYTPSGKVSIALTGNDTVVQFYVKDTGPGIPAEDVPHLFQKFYRVDNSSTRTVGGTGLGLFICKKIIEIYKGRIWAESEVGKGSTFYMNLPRLSSAKATDLQRLEAQNSSPAPVTSLTTPVV